MDLMGAEISEFKEKFPIELHAALGFGVDFYHPALNSIRIELHVPRRIERVREIDSAPIAAHFHHLRSPVQRCAGILGMRGAPHDAAEMKRTRFFWVERI